MQRRVYRLVLLAHLPTAIDYDIDAYPTKSGVGIWVDVDTSAAARTKVTSRGETWELVMSDEFELDGRAFKASKDHLWTALGKAGKDHLWTALGIPDGVDAALEYYNVSNVYTKGGKFINKVEEGPVNVTYFNPWHEKPGFENASMVLVVSRRWHGSWSKFCFQGGLIEVLAKLSGAIISVVDIEHPNPTLNPNDVGYQ
ncbi:Aste57867_10504 [Aphanomyces stellatus]|uniref:Aste57867_10504 protein n=1 Tax=Aphanomyces stellatus TaxID=120398 RepID=A0A485KR51_9STRA|nr:hypothetical protein As57867_010464 [Aphanomyces stellatus]VFT87377.1 Aste57867_10504 [Aphanomyces stellatus]